MKDFLGNEIEIGDFCVYLQNEHTRTGRVRKVMKKGIVRYFTEAKVVFEYGKIFPNDIVVIYRTGENLMNEI